MNRLRLPRLDLVALLLLAIAVPAHAADYCVGTPTQFQNALDDAEIDGADSVVKVRTGTYNLNDTLRYVPVAEYILPAGKLTVRGGYNHDCSSYSTAAGTTIINGGGNYGLWLDTKTASVAVAGLQFFRAFVYAKDDVYAQCLNNSPQFTFRRLRIDQSILHATALCHDVTVENTLITNGVNTVSTPSPGDTGLGIYLASNADYPRSRLTVINSSVINARTDIVNCCDGRNNAYIYNSIFDRPAGADIFSEANVYLRNNRYDGLSLSNGAVTLTGSSGNLSAAPQLNAQYVPVAGSPMLHSGTSFIPEGLPDIDQAGGERVRGPGVDRGALESPIDGTGIYVVTNTNASGNGSLANAVELANAEAGANTIRFNISGACPRRITLSAPLLIRQTTTIDGWSQPGNVINSAEAGWNGAPCIILNGGGSVGSGIEAHGDMAASAGRITARGLAFEGFALAVNLVFGEDHAIYGNQFGGRVGSAGPVLTGNQQAIGLIGGGRTVIGGGNAAMRNLIGGSSDVGILIATFLGLGGDDNQVINNLIGLDKNGTSALANGTGIRVLGGQNRIVGNRISGNLQDGILLTTAGAEENIIEDNFIGGGLGALSFTAGNQRMGVMIQNDAHDNIIGPNNIIGRNGDDGVRVMPSAGGRNRITANRIYRNNALGIDLGSNGVSANNDDPTDCPPALGCAANRGQNFPLLSSATRRTTGFHPVDHPVELKGTLRSVSGSSYRIEVFAGASCEANGHGEGYRQVATANVGISPLPYCPVPGGVCLPCNNGNCTAGFTVWLPELDLDVGDVVTATATSAGGDTSEFSACQTVVLETNNDLIFANGFQN